MNRIFSDYRMWEDYRAGMYQPCKEDRKKRVKDAVKCLGNPKTCEKAMKRVLNEWPCATNYNLSFKGQNRRAWLGQAACCIQYGVREDETREAWGLMTEAQRNQANGIAQNLIDEWCESERQISLFEIWGNNEKAVGN